jgi:hemolysin D
VLSSNCETISNPTYRFTKYGVINAEIANISDDAIVDEQRGMIFSTVLAMKQSVLNVEGRAVTNYAKN